MVWNWVAVGVPCDKGAKISETVDPRTKQKFGSNGPKVMHTGWEMGATRPRTLTAIRRVALKRQTNASKDEQSGHLKGQVDGYERQKGGLREREEPCRRT